MQGLSLGTADASYTPNFIPGNTDDQAEAYNNRGIAYCQDGEYDQAIDSFSKAVELDPNYVEIYNNRGIAYYCKGDFNLSIRDFNKAIQWKPSLAEIYNNRGIVYIGKGGFDKAIEGL